ncbi:hypothetical protein [Corynebacterium marinum]|uniref:Membrane protein n=1 Tax=Corynebacterium marinum DSM 44953 TaxID=1224162 RepID=A0A0B6TJ36_9CORY|nr:hypothetical protein [Corynebacterium marinum]AJK67933.1 membrane protein [Corynebacterium marinum DSM 44953]GGO11598.1 hypothetical protein GCM10010980_03140 [Corynebacterium marinum]
MSDKQLTVAELLARAGRDDKEGEAPRRRRRSLDEGGISVAELTGSIPAVKEKPVESKHSSVPIDGPEPEKPAPTGPAETTKPEAKKPEAKKPEAKKPETTKPTAVKPAATASAEAKKPAGATKPAGPKTEAIKPAEKTPATDETVVFGKVDTGLPLTPEQTGEIAVVDDVEEHGVEKQGHDEAEDLSGVEERTSVTGVVLLTIIGVVLGVVVFKGFEMLWENFSRPIVAVLAVLVTAGMVGVVKALRTSNDGLSMFMAGLVGLVMTFGPLAVVLI